MATAGEVLEKARDLHPSFTEQDHPKRVLLGRLSDLHLALFGQALARFPSLSEGSQEVSLPLANFAEGILLHAPFMLHEIECYSRDSGQEMPFKLIPYEHRNDPQPLYTGWIKGSRLFLRPPEDRWVGVERLVIRAEETPGPLKGDGDQIFMEEARIPLEYGLAAFMSMRRPQQGMVNFASLADSAERQFLEQLMLRRAAETHFIREID